MCGLMHFSISPRVCAFRRDQAKQGAGEMVSLFFLQLISIKLLTVRTLVVSVAINCHQLPGGSSNVEYRIARKTAFCTIG